MVAELEPDPAASPDARRPRRLAVVLSIAFHAALFLGLRAITPDRARGVAVIDIDTAPLPPLAELLPPEEPDPETPPPPPPGAEDEPALPEPPPAEPGALGSADAGVPDAPIDAPVDAPVDAAVDARPRRADAGLPDADAGPDAGDDERLAAGDLGDAGAADDAAAALDDGDGGPIQVALDQPDGGLAPEVTPDDGDGGLVAAAGASAPADGGAVGTGTAPGDDAGGTGTAPGGDAASAGGDQVGVPGADRSGDPAARPSAGTNANLLGYMPAGHVVTVLVRLDRLRGTEWADRVDALLRPLPDHRSLVGELNVRLADTFELLVVSSPAPQDATATTLVARTAQAPAELRDFLDQPDAPVAWTAVRGGALGRRGRSPRVIPGDPRVFLAWQPGWMTLTQPAQLGGLTATRAGPLDRAAAAADLPPWLARVATIADESGEPTGPALMVTAAGVFGAQIPMLGADGAAIPAPERLTLTVEVVAQGLLLRGTLRYADDGAAATAQHALERLRADLLARYGRVPVLGGIPLVTVLRGLSFQRTGRRLNVASSASIADGRALVDLATAVVTSHFEAARRLPAPPPARPAP